MTYANMTEMNCGQCGIQFYMPTVRYKECREEPKQTWYCPNGHPRVFRESDVDVARREAARLKQQLAERDDTIRLERERAAAAERETARVKKRINAGVCTCCNRTFTNLARHMKTKHSDVSNVVPLKTGAKSA